MAALVIDCRNFVFGLEEIRELVESLLPKDTDEGLCRESKLGVIEGGGGGINDLNDVVFDRGVPIKISENIKLNQNRLIYN
jgi:hypothetical protein